MFDLVSSQVGGAEVLGQVQQQLPPKNLQVGLAIWPRRAFELWYLKIKSLCLQVNFCGKLKYFKCRQIFGTTHLVSVHVRHILHLRFHQLMATRSAEKLVGFSDYDLESESFKAKFIWFWTNEENWITCQRTRGHKGEHQGLRALNK